MARTDFPRDSVLNVSRGRPTGTCIHHLDMDRQSALVFNIENESKFPSHTCIQHISNEDEIAVIGNGLSNSDSVD
jgi:hypothetical protein